MLFIGLRANTAVDHWSYQLKITDQHSKHIVFTEKKIQKETDMKNKCTYINFSNDFSEARLGYLFKVDYILVYLLRHG